MKCKKICIVTQELYSLGGVQRTVSGICNHLSRNCDIQICVLMHTYQKENPCFEVDSRVTIVDIADVFSDRFSAVYKPLNMVNRRIGFLNNALGKQIAKRLYFKTKELEKLASWINENGFDVVIGATASYALLVAFIADKISAKAIGWMHSTYDGYYRKRGNNLYGLEHLNGAMLGRLDRIFVLNGCDKRIFEKKCGVKCEILHNPICFELEGEPTPKCYDLAFVGRLNKKVKGLDFLVEIIKELKCLGMEDIRCVVVGDGSSKAFLEKSIKKYRLTDNIELVGFQKDAAKYYQESRVLLSTSRWEGFGMTITEAMKYGVPCVAFDNDGPAEIIKNGENGVLIPRYNVGEFAEQVKRCLQDNEKYSVLSQNAKKRAVDFSIDAISDRFLHLIEVVCNE